MNKEYEEEKRWFNGIKRKLQKYIASPYWDDLNLSDSYIMVITTIMNTTDVKKLSPLINESLVNNILNTIQIKLKQIKEK